MSILLASVHHNHANVIIFMCSFLGVDYDAKSGRTGVFKITSDRKRGWNKFVSKELGNYDYLLGADVGTKGFVSRNLIIHDFRWTICIRRCVRIC